MLQAQITAPEGELLGDDQLRETLASALGRRFTGQRVLVLIPDHTRSAPLPFLFRTIAEILFDVRQLDFMAALGSHPPLDADSFNRLLGISETQRSGRYREIGFLNHAWDDPGSLVEIGEMDKHEIRQLAGVDWHDSLPERVKIRINRAALDYDRILILGPTFPHEVVGFSGGAKYLFPGISGPEMVNATHWLGALAGVVNTIGTLDTPVRAMIHAGARRLDTPVTLAALTVEENRLSGLFIGGLEEAWRAAAEFSSTRHIRWCEKPYRRVLSNAPSMYDELWTGAKAMYKVEPAVEPGGEVVIHAPHLETVSRVHGEAIRQVGYHILPYFLANWDRYRDFPLMVLAHSSHLRGSGVMDGAVEVPNVRVTLASRIPPQECADLNLGYMDPYSIRLDDWMRREEEGILYVPRAGEILYKAKNLQRG